MTALNDTPAGNPEAVPVYEPRTLYQVPIDRVREDPDQPRGIIGDSHSFPVI
jgi:hypothetical protein